VRGVSLTVNRGETHCLVGESGCGKSVTALAVMGLLARGAHRTADVLRFHDFDLTRLSERGMARLRGDRLAMIFQEPMTSLNPAYTIGSRWPRCWNATAEARVAQTAPPNCSAASASPRRACASGSIHQLSGGCASG
jgi:ABC-type dipeptide/oligopeptide/nickel transport system ATPase component